MLFRQLFDKETSTYTYLLADKETHEAVLIDPVREQMDRDLNLLDELGLKLKYVLETHVHADHVTAAALLRQKTGAQVAYSRHSGVESADILLEDEAAIEVGKIVLEARLTPGHTNGDVTFVTADRKMAFTGDTLLIRGCGRTDFQQGDAHELFRSVKDKIFSLPDDAKLYPGHDYKGRTMTTVCEEKAHNARLRDGITEDEFVAIMDGLNLAYPKKIDLAVPANLRLGLLNGEEDKAPEASHWDEVVRTPTGVPEVTTDWVQSHSGAGMFIVDVREVREVNALGLVAGATHVPLGHVVEAAQGWDKSVPLVTICHSGGRSGRAALELEKMGFKVVSMAGGMSRWVGEGRPVTQAAA
jgi:glyoxylase-like metal-dependent hydrolase (beta-lactamase superfamily II)/rhodanese-related sulfurtransferase